MGARGPAPLPSNVHQLRGNPSKLPAAKLRDEVQPDIARPDAPAWLLPEAKREWKRLGPELVKLGLISKIDRAAFALYCQAWGRWVQTEAELKKLGADGLIESTPSGYKQMSVLLQIANRSADQVARYQAQFGLSPSARRGLVATPQSGQADMFGHESDDERNSDPAARYFGRRA